MTDKQGLDLGKLEEEIKKLVPLESFIKELEEILKEMNVFKESTVTDRIRRLQKDITDYKHEKAFRHT